MKYDLGLDSLTLRVLNKFNIPMIPLIRVISFSRVASMKELTSGTDFYLCDCNFLLHCSCSLLLKVFFFISEAEVSEHSTGITHLPPEVMLSIFSYLNPQELCRCSQVSTKWSQLAKTGSLWKHLYPVHWARGRYMGLSIWLICNASERKVWGFGQKINFIVDVVLVYVLEELAMVKYLWVNYIIATISFRIIRKTMSEGL